MSQPGRAEEESQSPNAPPGSEQDPVTPREKPQKQCDMVMKGGITSGVIYPLAVYRIAAKYRLRNIGGASAGAIAAAAAAAAEHGRAEGGYEDLKELPNELAGSLQHLFQAQRGTRPLMNILLATIDPNRSGLMKVLGLMGALSHFFGWFLAGLLIGALPSFAGIVLSSGVPSNATDWGWIGRGMIPILPGALIVAAVGTLAGAIRTFIVALPTNHFGLCTGMPGPKAGRDGDGNPFEALTPWLTRQLDAIARLEQGPLTFGHLWGTDGVDRYRQLPPKHDPSPEDRAARDVDLEMMTTDLGSGRPWRLPFTDRRFSFCPQEFREFFPESVVVHMERNSRLWEDDPDPKDAERKPRPVLCPHHGVPLVKFPEPPDLPVVVAARMSLSFPVLISAVPLYARDYTRKNPDARPPIRCYFSDGGMTSNFPIHFFDSLWPTRPTFGINLEAFHPDEPEEVSLPGKDAGGGIERPVLPIDSVFGFGARIIDTMQNWSDRGQAGLPGFRDRVVNVHHSDAEGGMNLSMPRDVIVRLAQRGGRAADLFDTFNFDDHRWVRFRTAMAEIEQSVTSMNASYTASFPNGACYKDFIANCTPAHYKGGERWRRFANEMTEALMEVAGRISESEDRFATDAPRPDPDLRVVPRY